MTHSRSKACSIHRSPRTRWRPLRMPWTTARWRLTATRTTKGFGVRSNRSNALLIGAGALTVLAAVFIRRPPVSDESHVNTSSRAGHEAAAEEGTTSITVPVVEAGNALANIGMALSATPEAATDVIFPAAATAYGRCEPAHAHEFGVMAARARLPVLAGLTSVLGP